MSVCFDGIGEVAATFKVKEGAEVQAGHAVTLTGNGEVGPGEAGGLPCGVVLHVEDDGYATVQIGGLARVGWSGDTAPALGRSALCVDGAGCVTAGADGVACLVVSVDEETRTAVIKL